MTTALATIGLVLAHFAWQGALIAAAAALALRALRSATPHTRHLVGCAALVSMLAAPAMTAGLLSSPAPEASAARTRRLVRVEIRNGDVGPNADSPRPFQRPLLPPAIHPVARLLPALGGAWLAGMLFVMARLAGGVLRVRAFHRRVSGLGDSCWQVQGGRIAMDLNINTPVRIVDAGLACTPTVLGWRRPLIVLPVPAIAGLTTEQVEAVLAHELAHVRRHDYLINMAQTMVEGLLFCHPGVWWLSRRIRAEREHACDDLAVGICNDRVGYAEALAELETFRRHQPRLALAMAAGSLVDRVSRVLTPAVSSRRSTGALMATLLFVAIAGMGARAAEYFSLLAPVRLAFTGEQDIIDIRWTRFSTDHFEVFVPPALEPRASDLGELAERVYRRVASDFRHDIGSRPQVLLFENQASLDRMLAAGVASVRPWRTNIRMAADRAEADLEAGMARELARLFAAESQGS